MTIAAALKDLGIASRRIMPMTGGALSTVYRVETAIAVFAAKTGPHVAAEGHMLRALAQAGAPVPRVINEGPDVLLLEFLHQAQPKPGDWARFGAALRALHKRGANTAGWTEDYAFGPVGIDNAACPSWPEFWAERRLRPFAGKFPELSGRIDAMCDRLPDVLPRTAHGLIHGDMWSGNLLATEGGVFMVDPACYHGHGEVDLAMLDLFGTIPAELSEGYGPLENGWEDRRRVYQLYPALVHLALFGQRYHPLVNGLLAH